MMLCCFAVCEFVFVYDVFDILYGFVETRRQIFLLSSDPCAK